MERTFNLGLGMVVVVPPESGPDTVSMVSGLGFSASPVGRLVPGTGRCVLHQAAA
jgi:phosphoribosylaminoimidazole (AIR) synthetase